MTGVEPGSWWDMGWHYRRKVTVDHSLVGENLSDFPVLISVDFDVGFANHVQDDGDDFVFTDETAHRLHHEIELFNGSSGMFVDGC